MSATSRNRARKDLYASQAGKASRNQDAIEGPLVGHFEKVSLTKECPRCEGDQLINGKRCAKCEGAGRVPTGLLVERIVHDDKRAATVSNPRPAGREAKAAKRRRQLAAWVRCSRTNADGGKHDFRKGNCHACGMPEGEVAF